jgi:hypothetical protein
MPMKVGRLGVKLKRLGYNRKGWKHFTLNVQLQRTGIDDYVVALWN